MPARLSFDRHRLLSGLTIHVGQQGHPEDPAVLMLHGYADSWFSFSRVLPLLPEPWHVVVPDLRGHGASEKPTGSYALDDFAGDAIHLLDLLGIDSAVVVGHSMGSLIAQRMAVLTPDRVSRLVLVGSAVATRNAALLALQEEVASLADPIDVRFVQAFQASTIHRPVPAEFSEGIVAQSLKVPARVWKAALDGILQADLVAGAARIGCPTLVLGGDRDSVFSPSEQEERARLIPDASLTLHTEIGHDPQWEAPEAFVSDLSRFTAQA
jgi:pimeloyl-ACP methyl ester carboxylesterase